MDSLVTTTTLTSRDIKVLHIEPTDVCQLACPLCARETDSTFDKTQHHHLTVDQIRSHFDEEFIAGLDKMFMCGNYGDPAAGRHTLELYRYFRSINSTITLGMNTNGALQNTQWWKSLAEIFNLLQDYVVFSIDGLEDTNHLYRKNISWSKLIENAQSYINAGGSAHWDMLVYQHNQHQVDQCRQLAKQLGFKWFRAKVSSRPFTDTLQFPVGWIPHRRSDYTHIDCFVLKEKSIYIDAQSRVSPCCWLGARQENFVTDFDQIQKSWSSDNPDPVCLKACGVCNNTSSFNAQWRIEEQLC